MFWGQHILLSGFSFCVYKMFLLTVPIPLGCLRIQGVIYEKYFYFFTQQIVIMHLLYADAFLGTWNTSVKQMCIFCGERGWEGK